LTNRALSGKIFKILESFQKSKRIFETFVVLARSACICVTASVIALAQRPAGWLSFSGDAQRTGWVKAVETGDGPYDLEKGNM
jgi:hypothetical protein